MAETGIAARRVTCDNMMLNFRLFRLLSLEKDEMNKIKSLLGLIAVGVIAAAVAGPAGASEDDALLKKGKKVFNKCKACHYITKEKNKIGPELMTVIGRKAGSLESYNKFSAAMKAADWTWDEANLAEFLTKPKAKVPGTKMTFPGLKKEAQRKAVIAYIVSKQKK